MEPKNKIKIGYDTTQDANRRAKARTARCTTCFGRGWVTMTPTFAGRLEGTVGTRGVYPCNCRKRGM